MKKNTDFNRLFFSVEVCVFFGFFWVESEFFDTDGRVKAEWVYDKIPILE